MFWPQAPAAAFAALAILPPDGGPGGRLALRSLWLRDLDPVRLDATQKGPFVGPFEAFGAFSLRMGFL